MGFGSDGYLYDFVRKRTNPWNYYNQADDQDNKTEQEVVSLPLKKPMILSYKRQKPRYEIWRAFGSDGYLYDFVK